MGPKQIWRLFKTAFQQWNRDKASLLAAALAYYTVFSLSPLLVLVLSIVGLFVDRTAAREQLMGQLQSLVGPQGAEFMQSALENSGSGDGGIIASIVSLVLLVVGASGVFAQLQTALNTVWDVEVKPEGGLWLIVQKRLLSFGMVLVIGFLLLVSLVASAAVASFSGMLAGFDGLAQLLNLLLSFGLTTLLFALIYKFLPDVEISWRDVWFGAVVTALLFSIGKLLIGLYLGNSGFSSSYGAAGSVVIVLAWVFYSTQILFFGAELTQAFAARYGSRIVPTPQARPR